MDKLNNLISFKDFGKFDMKVENQPGKKVVEKLNNIKSFDTLVDEGFFTDTELGNKIRKGAGFKNKGEKFEEAKQAILSHPIRRKAYETFQKEDPNKAEKYVEFFVKNPQGHPKWTNGEWIDTARYSHELLADVGSPKSGY